MFRIAVLSSGMSRGSNLRAMAEYFKINNLPVHISFAVRTRKAAPIAQVCDEQGITCHFIAYKNQLQFEEKVLYLCQCKGIHLLALSGFLKKLSPMFLRDLAVPAINIHPALLPKYGGQNMYGSAVHEAVYANQENESGATVHLVDAKYDHGKIIAQQKVDISKCRSPEEIAAAVLKVEQQLYGRAVWEFLNKVYS